MAQQGLESALVITQSSSNTLDLLHYARLKGRGGEGTWEEAVAGLTGDEGVGGRVRGLRGCNQVLVMNTMRCDTNYRRSESSAVMESCDDHG